MTNSCHFQFMGPPFIRWTNK